MSRTILSIVGAMVLCAGFVGVASRTHAQETSGEGEYATVNGLDLYYEIHGTGEPLVLLHGGLGGIVEFSQLLPSLAETRQVIAVEMQGHGHTADIDRPWTFEAMADDVAALIEQLGYEQADVMGFSLGGAVALQTAIRHPDVVRKLVLVSTPFSRDGWYPEVLAGMGMMSAENAGMLSETPMYQFYSSVAPDVEQWPVLVGKLGELLGTDYDWSADVQAMTTPTLLVVGDADSVRTAHAVEFFGLLGGGQADGAMGGMPNAQFAVLPGTTHFTILTRADLLLPIVAPFLDAPVPEAE